MEPVNYPHTIYSESTPNPASMKFVSNQLLWKGEPMEFFDPNECGDVPLARQLFQFPFVKSLFISGNFITVNKNDSIEWIEVVNELRDHIQSYLREGNPIINPSAKSNLTETPPSTAPASPSVNPEELTEVEAQIVDALDQYIRPGVESDGGAIQFKSFDEGIVTVTLRGACSGCPSSTVTLKAGIESVLTRLIPDVKEVQAEEL